MLFLTLTHKRRLRLSLYSALLIAAVLANSQVRGQSTEDSSTASASALDKTHVGGYGEITYTRPSNDVPRLNIPRFVIYLDHYFSDRWAFKSETEIEDVKVERGVGGEIGLEQAFLDYHANRHVSARAGLLLIPMGIINQTHEPNAFYSVERPLFDKLVIPTTWREIGAGIYGEVTEGVKYQAYVTEGLLANSIGMDGVDAGKQEGSAGGATSDGVAGSDARHPAVSVKFDFFPYTGFRVGAAAYYQANAFQGLRTDPTSTQQLPLIMGMLDARYERGPLHLRGEAGFVKLADSLVAPGPRYFSGGYVEATYNVLSFFSAGENELYPFVRYEKMTAYQRQNSGILIDDAIFLGDNVTSSVVAGLAFKPMDNLIVKVDYRWTTSDFHGDEQQLSLGAGFSF